MMEDGTVRWKILNQNKRLLMIIYGLLIILAIILRFAGINSVPLTSSESVNAVQALNLLSKDVTPSVGQPFYIIYTGIIFWLFSATEFCARLLPAFAGVLVVLTPLLFKKTLSNRSLLLLTAFLAIDPLLVGLSRLSSGDVIALLSLICIIGFVYNTKPELAGIALGIGILAGPFFWAGMTIVLITTALILFTELDKDAKSALMIILANEKQRWMRLFGSFTLTFLLLGSGFMSHPSGWQLAIRSMIDFFQGFVNGQTLPIKAFLIGTFGYGCLPLFLGLLVVVVQKITGKTTPRSGVLLFIVAVAVSVLYSSRNIYFGIFFILPLWLFVSRHLLDTFTLDRDDFIPYLIGTMVIITLIIFTYSNLRGMYSGNYQVYPSEVQIAALIGGFVLIGLTLILIIWGWGLQLGINLLLSAFGLVLLVYTAGATIGVMGSKSSSTGEMTAFKTVIIDEKLMVNTINDIAKREFFSATGVEIDVLDINEPSLDWALRNIGDVSHTRAISPTTMTPIIITPIDGQVESSIGYRGQDFVWNRVPNWNEMSGSDYLSWFITRKTKFVDEHLILWVRSDLFAE